jgi:hypothetical protein
MTRREARTRIRELHIRCHGFSATNCVQQGRSTENRAMEARTVRVVSFFASLSTAWVLPVAPVAAAGYKTTNFTVSAPTAQLAKEIGDQAEVYRKQLAIEWLGQELPQWSKPCPIRAEVAPNKGAGGATSFVFDRGEVFGWKMNIQGSRERILDSVLPHEVTHTIFASYFRQPVPRWADEGACTTMEHRSEIAKQERNLIEYLKHGRGLPFSQMFAMKEYPQDVMPLYAQGHSLAEWLIESRGRKAFLAFIADGLRDENWQRAVHEHYGFNDLLSMQTSWNDWVKQGRPQLSPASSAVGQLASTTGRANGAAIAASPAGLRMQSPDGVTPIATAAPSSPIKQASANVAVTVASPGSSVYVVAAGPTAAAKSNEPPASASAAIRSDSVYDASRGSTTLRR